MLPLCATTATDVRLVGPRVAGWSVTDSLTSWTRSTDQQSQLLKEKRGQGRPENDLSPGPHYSRALQTFKVPRRFQVTGQTAASAGHYDHEVKNVAPPKIKAPAAPPADALGKESTMKSFKTSTPRGLALMATAAGGPTSSIGYKIGAVGRLHRKRGKRSGHGLVIQLHAPIAAIHRRTRWNRRPERGMVAPSAPTTCVDWINCAPTPVNVAALFTIAIFSLLVTARTCLGNQMIFRTHARA